LNGSIYCTHVSVKTVGHQLAVDRKYAFFKFWLSYSTGLHKVA